MLAHQTKKPRIAKAPHKATFTHALGFSFRKPKSIGVYRAKVTDNRKIGSHKLLSI